MENSSKEVWSVLWLKSQINEDGIMCKSQSQGMLNSQMKWGIMHKLKMLVYGA